jgi:diguanylate cyclase (GGDEF)-like protein
MTQFQFGANVKVCIIDDVLENRVLMQKILSLNGFQNIITYPSATEFLDALSQSNGQTDIDVILMDVMMPDIDGITATQVFNEIPGCKDIPVIMVTANADSQILEKSFEAGAIDFVRKPIDKTELLARLKSALRLKREMDQRKQREAELLIAHQELKKLNERLEQMSFWDGLTGVKNRRFFDELLTQESQRATRQGKFISLILLDIDHFKAYNDTYGHLAGDDCLKKIAQTLDSALQRTSDGLFRYGGEEFAAILPNTDFNGAMYVAERLRREVHHLQIENKMSTTDQYVTISVGVVTMRTNQKIDPQILLHNADTALYEAKRAGRNCVKGITPEAIKILRTA